MLCHENTAYTKRNLGIDDNELSKYKFQSKTYYLKLKHFYTALQEFEQSKFAFQALNKRYLDCMVDAARARIQP